MIRSLFWTIFTIIWILGVCDLTGENGAAKSTLIKATLGILKPKKGTVTISETNKDGKKLRMAYLPQQIASFNAGFQARSTSLLSLAVILARAGSVV